MEQITLYHHGTPITCHYLSKNSFSIGRHPTNDLVLAAQGVAERELVVFRGADGCWRARTAREKDLLPETELHGGTRVAFGSFSIGVERRDQFAEGAQGKEITGLSMPDENDELNLVGESTHLHILRMEISRLGRLVAPVLISGETGTGKELIARGLHSRSERSDGAFVTVNCGGLTASLLEDTLFGHEQGAFTGAHRGRKGVFEQAHGGTLFLDEIGELPLAQQATLLRVLDDKQVRRIGGEKSEVVDFRLVAATNRDLANRLKKNKFRLDLYHRISTLRIETVPLRDRPGDVQPLAQHFLMQMARELGERSLSTEALEMLSAYPWPGNVRELRNRLYRAAAMSSREVLDVAQFELPTDAYAAPRQPFRLDKLADAKIEEILLVHGGNVAAAAREMGVPRTSLRDRLKRTPKRARRVAKKGP